MADRVEQRKAPENRVDNLALDQISVSPAVGEQEDGQLEKTHFSFAVEKEHVSELEQQVAVQRPTARNGHPQVKSGDKTVNVKGQPSRAPLGRRGGGGTTILDRIMNFVADLLERLDRAIFRRLSGKAGQQAEPSEQELTIEIPQTPPAAEARSARKKRERHHRRLRVKRE